MLNFLSSKLQGDFCVTAWPLSHANRRRRRTVRGERTGPETKAAAPRTGRPSAPLPPARALRCAAAGCAATGGTDFVSLCLSPLALEREREHRFPLEEGGLQQEERWARRCRADFPRRPARPPGPHGFRTAAQTNSLCDCSRRRRVARQDSPTTAGGTIVCVDTSS